MSHFHNKIILSQKFSNRAMCVCVCVCVCVYGKPRRQMVLQSLWQLSCMWAPSFCVCVCVCVSVCVCVCVWERERYRESSLIADALSGLVDMLQCCCHLVGWVELKAGWWSLWNHWLMGRLKALSPLKTESRESAREEGIIKQGGVMALSTQKGRWREHWESSGGQSCIDRRRMGGWKTEGKSNRLWQHESECV